MRPRGQGNRPVNNRPSSLRRIDDLHCTLIQDRVIIRFHADPDNFGSLERPRMPSGDSIPYLSISKRTANQLLAAG